MQYFKIDNYTIKLRIYPNKKQIELMDIILYELGKYYNITLYEALNLNPMITKGKTYKKDGEEYIQHWFSRKDAESAAWKNIILNMENRENASKIPSQSIATKGSITYDLEKALTKTGKNGKKIPLEGIKKPTYYSKNNPRMSFKINGRVSSDFQFTDNGKIFFLDCGCGIGKIKCRGLNKKLRFEDTFELSMKQFFESGGYCNNSKIGKTTFKKITCKISKDNCGDWYISICLPYVYKPMNIENKREECGIDIGVKEKAIIYNATADSFEHIDNKMWLHNNDGILFEQSELSKRLDELNLILSRKWGYKNREFRKAKKENNLIKPSKQYLRIDMEYKKLNRYITRCREQDAHEKSAYILNHYSTICLESLSINEWLERIHFLDDEDIKLSKLEIDRLHNQREFRKVCADSALGLFISLIESKAKWYDAKIIKIDKWFPSSQICSCCGNKNPEIKDVSIRTWICPKCGTVHNRDENAAYNIFTEGKRINK